jgi:hypothetical protein
MQGIKPKKTSKLIQTEHELHIECVQWFEMQHKEALLNHQANENPRGDKIQMIRYNKKMKSLGTKTGFPDLEIVCNFRVLYVELKSLTGKLSDSQKSLFAKFEKNGFPVHIIRTFKDFQALANGFIKECYAKKEDPEANLQ